MTGFMNSDGSALVGGLLPSGIGEALQLDSSGNLKIAGSITSSSASTGTNGSAIPTSSTLLGASDGTNLQQLLVESASNRNLRSAIYNGANELAVDASGRLTLVPNSSINVAQIAGVAPGLDNTNELRVSAYGKNVAAGDTAISVDASGNQNVKLVAGSALAGGVNVVDSAGTNKLAVDASGRLTSIIQAVAGTALAADQTNSILRTSLYVKKSAAGDTVLALGSATSANSMPVVIASDQGAIPITQPTSATGTITSVAGAASSTSLLASNANRKGAYFFNESTATLYLALAGSASVTAYTVQIPGNGFFEIPPTPVYTGAVFGIWSAATGSCRITEMS